MATPPARDFDAVLGRMYERHGVDTLPSHLESKYGLSVARVTQLDVGVFRVDRAGDRSEATPPLVVRLFSVARPYPAAEADLVVLQHLGKIGFPAERPFGSNALSSHDGQAVLVTEFVKEVAKAERPAHPIVRLGAIVGRLHGVPVPAGADRPAGALHHFAEGTTGDELRAAAGWLDSVEARVPGGAGAGLDALRAAVAGADGGDGLPEAFVHPDPVPKNAIFTRDGPVLVDWTSAGRGPRLASLTPVLRSGWAAAPFLKGYRKVVTLTDDERERLPELLFSRRLVDTVFRACREPASVPSHAKRLGALRRDCHAKISELLDA